MPLNPLEITGGLAIGEGVGGAIEATVEPRLQNFKNDQWSKHQDVPIGPGTAAEIAAEDVDQYDRMATEATFSGIDAARFRDLWGVTLTAPGTGELLNMLRRSGEVPIDFAHGLRKAKLETQWDDAIRNLRDVRIPGPDLAYMVVRGVVSDGGTLPSALPTRADRLQLPPQLTLDTLAEAAKTGWDAERFAALVARSGLAMAPVMAAQANFRDILTDNDYELTIARGDLFPAYAEAVKEVSRQILTAGEYAELELRGYYDRATRLTHTAKHGMSDADSDLLFDVLGRSIPVHQITTGEARGGVYKGPSDQIPEAYLRSLERGNLRPEYYSLAYANRYSYPSAFVVRSLLTDGAITQADGEQIFLDVGWKPDLAKKVAQHYAPTTTVALDPNVKKAHGKAWTEAQSSYIAEESTAADVQPIFDLLGVDATAAQEVVSTWNEIRALVRKQLSPKEIVKALGAGVTNPATGAPWTVADATAALMARGYSQADATVLIQE